MIALAGNFYIFAPRLTACLAAVLLAVRNSAAAWDMRAFLVLLVSHGNSSDRYCSGFSIHLQARRHVCLLRMADEVGAATLLSRFVFDRTISVVAVRFNTLGYMHVVFHTKSHMMRRVVRFPVYDLRNVGDSNVLHISRL